MLSLATGACFLNRSIRFRSHHSAARCQIPENAELVSVDGDPNRLGQRLDSSWARGSFAVNTIESG
jgi:hypothetical protein